MAMAMQGSSTTSRLTRRQVNGSAPCVLWLLHDSNGFQFPACCWVVQSCCPMCCVACVTFVSKFHSCTGMQIVCVGRTDCG
jgi:hypothetical protein